ncbi:unnamed protein product, partial [Meganyctiphanes norvegica]
DAPKPTTENKTSSVIIVAPQDTQTLACNITGRPKPLVWWLKEPVHSQLSAFRQQDNYALSEPVLLMGQEDFHSHSDAHSGLSKANYPVADNLNSLHVSEKDEGIWYCMASNE